MSNNNLSPTISNSSNKSHGWKRWFFSDFSGGVLLILAAAVALIITNCFNSVFIKDIWDFNVQLNLLGKNFGHLSIHFLVNEVGMTVFFFLVGLEIQDAFKQGILSSWKTAALPVFAALGGMIFPAFIYLALTHRADFYKGWGIPVATDIAFGVGMMLVLGNLVPLWARLCLMAIAVVDDIGSILIISLFYNKNISITAIGTALFLLLIALWLRKKGEKRLFVYALFSLLIWIAVFYSGVHVTLTGLLMAYFWPQELSAVHPKKQKGIYQTLHRWVTWVIVPLFALGNSAIVIPHLIWTNLFNHPVFWGVFCGLLIGKPLGITIFAFGAVRLNWANLPERATWTAWLGLAIMAGIGFTMSIFITQLAFEDKNLQDIAKIAILLASIFAVLCGSGLYALTSRKQPYQNL